MGTDLITATDAPLEVFLTNVSTAKRSILAAINSSDSLRAAFAEADAKMVLLSAMDEKVSAYLLRFCDPDLQMVEVVNCKSDKDKVRVVALAILNGFVPGDDDFAVFGSKDGAKLYIKESGYRKLFARLQACRNVDATPGHPMFVPLGTGDKKAWRVEGAASCEINGEVHKIECLGKFAIGLPGHETDNVAGIAAKARRRLLQLLWKKVCAMRFEDHDETEQPSVTVTEPAAIMQAVETQSTAAAAEPREPKTSDPCDWNGEWARFGVNFGKGHTTLIYARRMKAANSPEALAAIGTEVEQLDVKFMGQRDRDRLRLYRGHLAGLLAQQPEAVSA